MKAFTLLDLAFLSRLGAAVGGLEGLAAWWKLNESTGHRADASGHAHTLVADDPALDSVAGVQSNAAHLVTADGRALTCSDAGLAVSGAFTLHFWFKRIAGEGHLLSRYDDAIGNAGGFFVNYAAFSASVQFLVSAGSSATSVFVLGLTDNTWYFIAFAFDPVAGKLLYSLNAAPWTEFSYTDGIAVPDAPFVVGHSPTLTGDCEFALDELALWIARLLTNDELAVIYNSGAGVTYPPFS